MTTVSSLMVSTAIAGALALPSLCVMFSHMRGMM